MNPNSQAVCPPIDVDQYQIGEHTGITLAVTEKRWKQKHGIGK